MRCKRIVSVLLLVLLAGVGGWMLAQVFNHGPLSVGSPLPRLSYSARQGETLLLPEPGRPTLIVLFHQRCAHCSAVLRGIRDQRQSFRNVRVLLLTTEQEFDFIFAHNYTELNAEPNVQWGRASAAQFQALFGRYAFPTLYLFGRDQRLLRRIRGQVKADYVLRILQAEQSES